LPLCDTKLCPICPHNEKCGGCPGCDRVYIKEHTCQKCLFTCVDKPGALSAAHYEWNQLEWKRPTLPHSGLPTIPLIIHTIGSLMEESVEWEAWIPRIYKIRRPPRSASRSKFIALHGYSPDSYLAALWAERQEYWDYYQQFDLVFTPNFSIYDNAPRLEQLVNFYRTTQCYAEMVDAGLPVVLDVAWGHQTDIDRWIDYINSVHPPSISMSLQGIGSVKSSKDWVMVAMGYALILKNIPEDIEVIFVGVGSKSRAKMARELTGRNDLHFMNTSAYMQSRYGRLWNGKKSDDSLTRDQIFKLSAEGMLL